MEANIYYPFNLNLYDFKCPDFKQYKFKYDHAYYIVHLICSIPLYEKKCDAITGVPLSAKALQKIIPNYKEYLQWLIDNGVIKTNNHYDKGKARKYSLTKRYQQRVREDKIFNYTLKKRVIKHRKNRCLVSSCAGGCILCACCGNNERVLCGLSFPIAYNNS